MRAYARFPVPAVAALTQRVEASGLGLVSLEVKRLSLEEAFLRFTAGGPGAMEERR